MALATPVMFGCDVQEWSNTFLKKLLFVPVATTGPTGQGALTTRVPTMPASLWPSTVQMNG